MKLFDDDEKVLRLEEARLASGNKKVISNGDEHKTERQIVGEMISDTEYVIEWLETGKRSGNKRGIERRAAYE